MTTTTQPRPSMTFGLATVEVFGLPEFVKIEVSSFTFSSRSGGFNYTTTDGAGGFTRNFRNFTQTMNAEEAAAEEAPKAKKAPAKKAAAKKDEAEAEPEA